MSKELRFKKSLDFKYGELAQLSPLIGRIICNNPSPFTYFGTGTYLVGHKELMIIDPGPNDDTHLEALIKAIGGREVTHILVTHSHADHSPLSVRLSGLTGARIWGRSEEKTHKPIGHETEEGDDCSFSPDIELFDGQVLENGEVQIRAIHTPGHTAGHFCFELVNENALFTGDHIMGWSTSVIIPPDGNMNKYLQSLETVRDFGFAILYPTHGASIPNPHEFINAYIAHRLEREAQVLECLKNGLTTIEKMVPIIYANTDKRLWPAAARSLHAHLIRLVENGIVRSRNPHELGESFTL